MLADKRAPMLGQDSLVTHLRFPERTNGTTPDSIGDNDGTINGTTNVEDSDWLDGYGENGDGSDHINIGSFPDVFDGLNDGMAMFLTFETTDTGQSLFGFRESGSTNRFNFDNGDGLRLTVGDANGDLERITLSDTFADGQKHLAIINIESSSASDFDIFVDNMETPQDKTVGINDGASDFSEMDLDVFTHAENENGSARDEIDAGMGQFGVANDSLLESERKKIASLAPFLD